MYCKRFGMATKPTGLKVVTITLPLPIYISAQRRAKADNRTFSNFVRVALLKILESK